MRFNFFRREKKEPQSNPPNKTLPAWTPGAAWILAGVMLLLLLLVIFQTVSGIIIISLPKLNNPAGSNLSVSSLPNLTTPQPYQSISRKANLDTTLPQGYRKSIMDYTVEAGDSIFGISKKYEVKPESILWANYDTLNDDPHTISIGVKLRIPPVDGVLYEWQEGDTLDNIAAKFGAKKEDILLWPGNDLDMTNPVIQPGTIIMVPGGYREFRTWVVPVVASNQAGVNAKIAGPGSCTPQGGASGTLSFVWPTLHPGQVTGNDYWGGHRALDMMCYEGEPVFASDSGVVIYSGSIGGGYGNLVAIDHGNSYLTLYAHLNGFNISCGQSVARGAVIGYCGNTGNSTGPHLHFEVRKGSGFINPWQVLQ